MTAPRTLPLERLQVFLRYGSGFEEGPNDKLIVGEELTCFLQLRPPDRVTARDKRLNPLLSGVSWINYERPDYDGGRYAPGWVGCASEIDVSTTASTPPPADVAACWVVRDRQSEGSTSWFPAHIRPVTGTIEHINEISVMVEGGLLTGIDKWLLESAVVRSVSSSSLTGLLEKSHRDEGRTLVVVSVLLSEVRSKLS